MRPNTLIGCDPEFFVKYKGELISAHGLVKGTKEEPQVVKGGAVQVDGMALEFNTDPAATQEEFLLNIKTVLGEMRKLIPAKYSFAFQPVAEFGRELIAAQPEKARELGCEPDFCAYTMDINTPPNAEVPFRTASGHIHIGTKTDLGESEKAQLVVLCDIYLGLPSLFHDPDVKRRDLYGKAGCFRNKPYGIEYRTLSNFWLQNTGYMSFYFNQAVKAAESVAHFPNIMASLEHKFGIDIMDIERIINRSDHASAGKILDFLGVTYDVR